MSLRYFFKSFTQTSKIVVDFFSKANSSNDVI